jgi:hypothetical protein
MPSLRNLGFNQRVHTVCSEDLDWANGNVERCIRNRGLGFDGYIPTLNQFRGQKAQIANGVWRLLNMPLTINSVTPTPLTFVGQDAVAGGWPERHGVTTLAVQSGGGLAYQQPGALRDNLGYLALDGTGFFQAPDNDVGDVDTKDYVLELFVGISNAVASGSLCGKRISTGGLEGWVVRGDSLFSMLIDAGAAAVTINSAALANNSWNHLLYIIRRVGFGICYTNGAAGSAVDVTSVAGSLTCAAPLRIGIGVGSASGPHSIAYFALRSAAGWLDTHLQPDIAKQRAAALFGWLPLSSKGSNVPNTMSRAGAAYSDRRISSARKYFFQGPNAMRWSEPVEGTHGPLAEVTGDNDYASEDINTWTPVRCTISGSTIASPIGTARGIVGTAVDDTHVVTLAAIGAVQDVFSVLAKAGNKEWLYLDSAFGPNRDCYYHLTGVGAIGSTPGANVTAAYIEPEGDGYYWCTIVYPGGGNHLHTIGPAHADNDNTFLGDGSTVNLWVDWAQHEDDGHGRRTSPMLGGTTRLADQFQMVAGDNIGGEDIQRGTIALKILTRLSTGTSRVISITDGGDAAERINAYILNGTTRFITSSGGSSQDTTGAAIADGAEHECRYLWDPVRQSIRVDGVETQAEVPTGIPQGLDETDVMASWLGGQQPNAILPVLRFLAQPSVKG